MKTRNVAIAVFYDKNLNIIIQERGKHSRVGEKYGFWGGQVEKGETPKQALKRELLEEIGFVPGKLDYAGKFSYTVQEKCKYHDWLINFHVFLSPIDSKFKIVKTTEGKGMLQMDFERVVKGEGFPVGSTKFLKGLKLNFAFPNP